MKKAKLLSLLLVLVMATSALLGGTIAKYTTTDKAGDSAQVAKWGVVLKVDGNLYGVKYKDATNGNQATVATDGANFSVFSAATPDPVNVVAPGTKNDTGITFSLTGKAETSLQVAMEIKTRNVYLTQGTYGVMVQNDSITAENFDDFKSELYVADDDVAFSTGFTSANTLSFSDSETYYSIKDQVAVANTYYPVVYTADGDTDKTGSVTQDTLDMIAKEYTKSLTGVEATPTAGTAPEDLNKNIYTAQTDVLAPNTDLASLKLTAEQLTWKWEYNAADPNHDKADTILGNLIDQNANGTVVKLDGSTYKKVVDVTDYSLNTCFEIEITVTQAD